MQTLHMSENSKSSIDFGERFYSYSRRIQKIIISPNFPGLDSLNRTISPSVIATWAKTLEAQKLFPRLRDFSASDYAVTAAGARDFLQFLTQGLPRFHLTCPLDLVLDTSECERLRLAGSGLRRLSIFSPWIAESDAAPQLMRLLIKASTHLEDVDAGTVSIFPSEVLHLGECRSLTVARLRLAAPHPILPNSAFRTLTQLNLNDVTDETFGLHFCLALSTDIPMLQFSYQSQRTNAIDRSSFRQLTDHITRWTSLVSVSLDVSLREHDQMPLEDSRTFYSQFHSLSNLESLSCITTNAMVLDYSIIQSLLDACPHLLRWFVRARNRLWRFEGWELFELPLPDLLQLLFYHPDIRHLPVRVRCDEMVDPQYLDYFEGNKYNTMLFVNNVIDPGTVARVFEQVLPEVTGCMLAVGADAVVTREQYSSVDELNRLLKAAKE
jgi:hypothetical protein